MAPDGTLWITAFLACLRIGALVTAVSTFCTSAELAHILRHSDTQIFLGVRRTDTDVEYVAAFVRLAKTSVVST